MSYITELRALVGSRPLVLPGSSVVLVDSTEAILLVERTELDGWGLPGGFMEPGESLEEAAIREVREETGLEVHDLSLLGVFSGPEYFHEYKHGDQVYNVTAGYLARVASGRLRVDAREVCAAQFFRVADLPDNIVSPERPIIARYLAGREIRSGCEL